MIPQKRLYILAINKIAVGVALYVLLYMLSILIIASGDPFAWIISFSFIIVAYYGSAFYKPLINALFNAIVNRRNEPLEKLIKANSIKINGRLVDYEKDSLSSIIFIHVISFVMLLGMAIGLYFVMKTDGGQSGKTSFLISYGTSQKILNYIFVGITLLGLIRGRRDKTIKN